MHSLVWDPLVSRSIIEAASGHAYLMEEQNLPSCSIYRVQTGASCRIKMSAAAPSGTLNGDFFLSFTHAYAECRAISLTTSTMCFFRKVLFSWPFFTKHTAYIVKDFCKEISNHKTLIIYFQSQTTANGCETKEVTLAAFANLLFWLYYIMQRQIFPCYKTHYFVSYLWQWQARKGKRNTRNYRE